MGDLDVTYCCQDMLAHSAIACEEHDDPRDCSDVLVIHSEQHGPGLPIRDGGPSFVTIMYCPWYGKRIR